MSDHCRIGQALWINGELMGIFLFQISLVPADSLFFFGGLKFHNARKHLIPLLKVYAGDHLVLTEDSICYRQSPDHSTRPSSSTAPTATAAPTGPGLRPRQPHPHRRPRLHRRRRPLHRTLRENARITDPNKSVLVVTPFEAFGNPIVGIMKTGVEIDPESFASLFMINCRNALPGKKLIPQNLDTSTNPCS